MYYTSNTLAGPIIHELILFVHGALCVRLCTCPRVWARVCRYPRVRVVRR